MYFRGSKIILLLLNLKSQVNNIVYNPLVFPLSGGNDNFVRSYLRQILNLSEENDKIKGGFKLACFY